MNHAPNDAPRQTNGHDCGLYVLAVADALCSAHAAAETAGGAGGGGEGRRRKRSAGTGVGAGAGAEAEAEAEAERVGSGEDEKRGGDGETELRRQLNDVTPKFVEDFRFDLLDLVETLSEPS